MSRGPGTWQRVILDKLTEAWAFPLRWLLPEHPTRAQRNALNRAACQLEGTGRISVARFMCWGSGGAGGTYIHRLGTEFTGQHREEFRQKF